jgi:hypothetical protein
MYKWEKIGKIIDVDGKFLWNHSHAMLPVADHLYDDYFKIYYSGRNSNNISYIGSVTIDITNPHHPLESTEKPLLSPGDLGCFDDNGVSPSCILNIEGKKLLYYIGWKPRSTTRMSVIAGLAESVDGGVTYSRVSRAPILIKNDREPYDIMTAPWVIKDEDIFRMWYVSGEGWKHPDLPVYNIKYAESLDGLKWDQKGLIAINAINDDETSLARPCVVKEQGKYKMWYSYKRGMTSYRIGYAESADGFNWMRMDDLVGISPSDNGWDSDMIEYASVFSHKGETYMLFNGNGYGSSGAGLAILS